MNMGPVRVNPANRVGIAVSFSDGPVPVPPAHDGGLSQPAQASPLDKQPDARALRKASLELEMGLLRQRAETIAVELDQIKAAEEQEKTHE